MERVIAESKEDTGAPLMQACAETTLLRGDRPEEFLVDLPVPCIKAAVADHFEMLFGDMADEAFDEIHGRDSLLHISPIFMAVIMECFSVPSNGGRGLKCRRYFFMERDGFV